MIEKGEDLVGFAKGQLYNHADYSEFAGELNKIYILRKYQKLGLGRQIIYKVANEFIQRGVSSMLLFATPVTHLINFMNGWVQKNYLQRMATFTVVMDGQTYKVL